MLLEWWSGTECTLFSDEATVNTFGKEHVIIILNHNFEIDFLCGWTMTERFGVLGVRGAVTFSFIWWTIGLFKTHTHTISLHLSFQL